MLTTHDLQDIEALCSRVIMLDDGSIIYDGGLEELKTTWSKGREIQFQFGEAMSISRLQQLTSTMKVAWTRENEFTATLFVPHEVNFSEAMGLVVGGAQIRDIKIFETNTDDIVRGIYQTGSAEVKDSEDNTQAEHVQEKETVLS